MDFFLNNQFAKSFDEICEVAKFITQCKFSTISIIDKDKVFYKNPEGNEICEMSKDQSFCHYTINEKNHLEVINAKTDERFKNNIFVTHHPQINYYLGVPLKDQKGKSLGSLCCLDQETKKSTTEQIHILKKLANQIVLLIEKNQTEQELLRSKERFKAVAELSPDIISIIDKNGVLVFNSSAAERIHGYSTEEMQQRNTFELIHPDHLSLVQSEVSRMFTEKDYITNVQYQYKNKDGSYVWMEATGINQFDNPYIEGLITISRKIEDRKKLEFELKRLNEDLDQKVKERTDQLLNIEKTAFIGTHTAEIIHNLNNPLTILSGNLMLLTKKFQDEKSIEKAQGAVTRIKDIVKNILEVSRNNFKNSTEEINLNEIILSELKFLEADHFYKHNIQLETCLENIPKVFGVPSHFSQCIGNLIKNAAESMHSAAITKLKVTSAFKDQKIFLTFEDTGHGISQENIEKIFDPFFTTKPKISTGSEPTGTGLGLASVKRMLEAYGADIKIDSVVGKGTIFTLIFNKNIMV